MAEDLQHTVEITVEFTCDECGQALDTSQKEDRYRDFIIMVTPCATCVQKAKDEGYDEGQADA